MKRVRLSVSPLVHEQTKWLSSVIVTNNLTTGEEVIRAAPIIRQPLRMHYYLHLSFFQGLKRPPGTSARALAFTHPVEAFSSPRK